MLCLYIYLHVFSLLFIDLVLGVHHYCDQLEVMYILCIMVPIFSLSCMARPSKNSVMKRHVLSPKYLQYLDYVIFMIKSNAAKVFLTTALFYAIRMLYFWECITTF